MYNIVNIYLFMLKQFIYIVQIAESMFKGEKYVGKILTCGQ